MPLVVTVVVITFLVNFLTRPFMTLVSGLLSQYHIINRGFLFLSPEKTIRYGSELVILFCIFLFIWLLGMLAKKYFIHLLINGVDNIMHRLPVVNKIYKTTKEIIHNIFNQDKHSFKQVVVVPFPGEGIYVIGFLTSEAPIACSISTERDLLSVFVPTTPNPTTGFLLMYEKSHIRYVDMKVETAIKYIVSCGLISKIDKEGDLV
jgi:uncharacterized membrane protein